MSTTSASLKHIPALDGLRGVAISLVMIHHFLRNLHFSGLPERMFFGAKDAFWVGVDLFFCLSGFLITRIVCDTLGERGWLRIFYGRRFLRVFPLYYTYLCVLFLILPRFGIDAAATAHAKQGWYWLYGSNILTAHEGWPDRWVQHFWSLAIEEQYYLVWPCVVFVLPARWRIGFLASLVGAGVLFRAYLSWNGAAPTFLFVSTLTRLDALCLGSLLALWMNSEHFLSGRFPRNFLERGGAMGLAALAVSWVLLGDLNWDAWSATEHILAPLAVSIGCAALVSFAVLGEAGKPWLENPVLCLLGKFSYGMYVLHIAVSASGRKYLIRPILNLPLPLAVRLIIYVVILGVGSLAFAWLSWHLLEKRFLALKRFLPYSRRS